MLNRIFKKLELKVLSSKSTAALTKKLKSKSGVIFLMYHSTPETNEDYLFTTNKNSFEMQVKFLSEHCNVLSVSQGLEKVFDKESPEDKLSVAITFDDGFKNNLDIAIPILEKHQLPATIFLTTDFISNSNNSFLNWEQVEELSKSNLIELGAHGASHANLKCLDKGDLNRELLESKSCIESVSGKPVRYLAYPSGGYCKHSMELVQKNYHAAFKDRMDGNADDDKRKVGRIGIDSRQNDLKSFLVHLNMAKCL